MFGSSEMYTALNITDITSLLDTYASSPALFSDDLLPQDFGADKKSINYYRVGLYDGGLEYSNYSYSINCRAKSKTESETIAQAVKDGINRTSYSDYFIVVNVLQTIPPIDDTDSYNTPLETTIKGRP